MTLKLRFGWFTCIKQFMRQFMGFNRSPLSWLRLGAAIAIAVLIGLNHQPVVTNVKAQQAQPCATPSFEVKLSPSVDGGAWANHLSHADVNGDGKTDLIASVNDNYSTKEYGQIGVYLSLGNGRFEVPTYYRTIGTRSWENVVTDLNGDGKKDIAVVSYFGNEITVFLNNGDGSFSQGLGFLAATESFRLRAGDFNGDGKPDLAVLNWTSSRLTTLYNQGNGIFGQTVSIATGGLGEFQVDDTNNDGFADIIATEFNGSNILLFTGKAGTGFNAVQTVAVGFRPRVLLRRDFNGDGKLDMVTANYDTANVSVVLNNGSGGFSPRMNYAVALDPVAMAAGDYNGDGRLDLIVGCLDGVDARATNPKAVILLNNGSGGFTAGNRYDVPGGFNPLGFWSTDVNQDGKADLVCQRLSGTSFLSVWLGDGIGNLTLRSETGVGGGTLMGAVNEDFNADGKSDFALITSGDEINILLNQGRGDFANAANTYGTNQGSQRVAVGDFNNDGQTDLIVSGDGGPTILRSGEGGRLNVITLRESQYAVAVTLADLNLDGKPDLVSTTTNNTLMIRINNGSGGFNTPYSINAGIDFGSHLISADFNLDGKPDLAIASQRDNRVAILLGNGAGNFQTPNKIAVGSAPAFLGAGDFNLDGKLDLVSANQESNNVSLLLGNGIGNFTTAMNIPAGNVPVALAVADLNGDAKPDLAVGNALSQNVSILLGNGIGGFTAGQSVAVDGSIVSVVADDFNGDGKPDLATADRSGETPRPSTLSVFPGNGNGTFAQRQTIQMAFDPMRATAMTTGDFNRDNKTDVAVAFTGTNIGKLLIFPNACGAVTQNTPPTIATASASSRQQGSPTGGAIAIATVNDAETAAGTLTVTATTLPAGLSVTNITNANGTISANIAAGCNATVGANTVVLTVNDGTATVTANLTVNVTANTPPVLGAYPAVSRLIYQYLEHQPSAPPTDNGSIASITATAPGTFGPFAVNTTTGIVTHSQVSNAGEKLVTVTATDNCQAISTATFPLTINKLRTEASISAPFTLSGAYVAGEEFRFRVGVRELEGSAMTPPTTGYLVYENNVVVDGFTLFPGASRSFVEFRTTTLRPGSHTLTTRYSGDNDRLPSPLSAPVTFYVNYPLASASAASYSRESFATEQIIAAFGTNLATTTQSAQTLPLPTTLAGTTVKISDGSREWLAPLFFVSPGQVNYLMPAGITASRVVVTITNGEFVSAESVSLAATAPGLFAANATGRGLAAAQVLRVLADGTQRYEDVARFDTASTQYVPIPIDLSNASEQVFLVLYGTGLRARTSLSNVMVTLGGSINAEALYAGPQGLSGLDQVNLRLPRSLAGRGDIDVAMTVDGKAANTVRVNVR